ncbi:hypothetical protein [Caulobacter sp. 17J65-9]|uniref:hypothetical protein n=1 Tax=Caulobacter sp. 17J65-9 TaxID=2709382 RepID=UPI0013CA5286|nr:hypothetical protein [Caulobacter sp. 17J65-9]NEX94562.1 hypothetical protein [Caulobacter sp. 17J65-9]
MSARTPPFAVAASLLIAAPAAASVTPADLEPAFTGTVISTYPDGRQGKLWLNRDGSYKGQGRRGHLSSGRWSLKGDRICLRQSRPVPVPFQYCTDVPDEGTTSWTEKAVTGEQLQMELVAGR